MVEFELAKACIDDDIIVTSLKRETPYPDFSH